LVGERQTLRDTAGNTQAGKRAGAGGESQPVQIGKARPASRSVPLISGSSVSE
jgi:hypothetical protein